MQGDAGNAISGVDRALSRGGVISAAARGCAVLWKLVGPLAIVLLFFTTVVPIGLVMRALGKDPLRLRRDPVAASYWITRKRPGPPPDAMKNQF